MAVPGRATGPDPRSGSRPGHPGPPVEAIIASASQLARSGQLADAESLYRRALAIQPFHVQSLHALAMAALQRDHAEDALALLQRALVLQPDHPDIARHLAAVRGWQADRSSLTGLFEEAVGHHREGRIRQAETAYRRILAGRPDHPAALNNLGLILYRTGAAEAAFRLLRWSVAADPEHAEAHNNLSLCHKATGRMDLAAGCCRRAIALKPGHADAYANLGLALQAEDHATGALSAYRRALRLDPQRLDTRLNLGTACMAWHRMSGDPAAAGQAVEGFRTAIAVHPDFMDAYHNLGNTFSALGRLGEAAESYRRAAALAPDFPAARAALTQTLREMCDWAEIEAAERTTLSLMRIQREPLDPFFVLGIDSTAADQQLAARLWAADMIKPIRRRRPPRPARPGAAQLRLGYLSADYHQHATAWLTAGLFERHDRAEFEVIGYSFGPEDGSPMRRRLIGGFDRFVDLREHSHHEAARQIYRDGVDILIDLKGYTRHARPQILARRPAPQQVSFLGYPGTLGADFIDHVIADPIVLPLDQQPFYDERILHLPDCYQPNDKRRPADPRTPSRQECGLPADGFVFCCFNNTTKITPAIFSVWTGLLEKVPGSVLWLLEANPWAKDNLCRQAALRGIDPGRLVFAPRLPLPAHLARHRLADLFLDTLPYNAHTTASDALWAGLPLVTCLGQTFPGRVAASLLNAIGLPELITESLADYAALALDLATRPARLAALRARLAANRATAPLFDCERFTRSLEDLYRQLWRAYLDEDK